MGVPAKWDDAAFFHSAQLQYTQPDRTLFKNILQLKPGHFLTAKNGVIHTACYWDMDYPVDETVYKSDEEAISEFSALFDEAVSLRLQADVDVCFHLSGGLDSSAVLGAATARMSSAPHAFTVTFDHEGYDEYAIAEETAKHLGAVFHPVRVTQDDLVHHMPEAVFHGEGMAINGHLAAKYLLNKAIRQAGFKVALTGEGADEVLAGYPHLRQDLFRLNAGNEAVAAQLEATNHMSAGVQIAFGEKLPTAAVQERLGYVPAFLEAKAAMGFRTTGVLSTGFSAGFCRDATVMRNLCQGFPFRPSWQAGMWSVNLLISGAKPHLRIIFFALWVTGWKCPLRSKGACLSSTTSFSISCGACPCI
jgi:asparagine synthase (glutamine-hydrolysing)